ncbi:MAG TPA: alpha/beta hydrolase [Longimicrobium sp.]|nr:alpha/beta hydrolase [Longimicrobium sp.]
MTLDQQLAAFRPAHPPARLRAAGHEWAYLRAGSGGPAVLLLGGALGRAEFAFLVVAALEDAVRVIAPDYPPVRSLREATDGLAALLDAEGVRRAHVVGGSFGGVVAQAFARKHPEHVASLVLSHTGAPDRGKGRGGAVRILNLLPGGVLRWMLGARVRGTLSAADPFWTRQFDEVIAGLSKGDVLSRIALAAEFGARYGDAPRPERPPYPVLIVEADDDPLFTRGKRTPLHALYPDARVHVFHGTGHAAGILKPDEYAAVIRGFVEEAEGAVAVGPAD